MPNICHFPGTASVTSIEENELIYLELKDGTLYQGRSFGAKKSIVGELVFQTGMVGYPESLTDPSYRGQILVLTYPLIGNYGVPSRDIMDPILGDLPAHFESSRIHVAGLIIASYSGENYSHFLATSSLGTWLKEQGVPAISGIDTRALTKRLRENGSTLGRILSSINLETIKNSSTTQKIDGDDDKDFFLKTEWNDPNERNLVAEGEYNHLSP